MGRFFSARQISGYFFLIGNISLFLFQSATPSPLHMTASIMLTLCSVFLVLSDRDARWLYATGGFIVVAYALIAGAAGGDGRVMQIIGTIFPAINGLLLIRSAWQVRHPKRFQSRSPLLKPLEIIDRYPVAAAGIIQLPGTIMICFGAFTSGDPTLGFASSLWILAALCMVPSDPDLRRKRAQ